MLSKQSLSVISLYTGTAVTNMQHWWLIVCTYNTFDTHYWAIYIYQYYTTIMANYNHLIDCTMSTYFASRYWTMMLSATMCYITFASLIHSYNLLELLIWSLYEQHKRQHHNKLPKARLLSSSADEKLHVTHKRCLSFSVLQCLIIKKGECWTSWKWASMTSAQNRRAGRCRHADSWACKHQNRPT